MSFHHQHFPSCCFTRTPHHQIGLFLFTAYFVFAIRRKRDNRRIFVPDITQGQVLANNVPGPDQLMYRKTTYFQHEMMEVGQRAPRSMPIVFCPPG